MHRSVSAHLIENFLICHSGLFNDNLPLTRLQTFTNDYKRKYPANIRLIF